MKRPIKVKKKCFNIIVERAGRHIYYITCNGSCEKYPVLVCKSFVCVLFIYIVVHSGTDIASELEVFPPPLVLM